MNDIITYVTGVVACSAVFTLFYRTVMHRRTSFRTARVYLPASLAAAAIIPALDIPVWRAAPVGVISGSAFPNLHNIPAISAEPPFYMTGTTLWMLWGVGFAALAVVMACRIVHIVRIKRRADTVHGAVGCKVVLSNEVSSPFSFLDTVFVECGTSEGEMRQIVLHEASHIRHRHSQEKIAMEVFKSVLWFNPFAWWAARLLTEVHEFEADRDVLDGGASVQEYLALIFRQIFGCNPELSVGLGDSLTKKRFLMMKNSMKLTKYSRLRVAGVLPLVAGMMLLFSFTDRLPETTRTQTPALDDASTPAADSTGFIIFKGDAEAQPLFIVDGKEVSAEQFARIDQDAVKSVTVLKDDDSTERYGERGANGVVLITTKKGADATAKATDVMDVPKPAEGSDAKAYHKGKIYVAYGPNESHAKDISDDVMIIVDGREVSVEWLGEIEKKHEIESMSVLTGEAAKKEYPNAKGDVIIIATKKEK